MTTIKYTLHKNKNIDSVILSADDDAHSAALLCAEFQMEHPAFPVYLSKTEARKLGELLVEWSKK